MFAKLFKKDETLPTFAQVFNVCAADNGKSSTVVYADGLSSTKSNELKSAEMQVPVSYEIMQHAAMMAVIHTELLDLTPDGIEKIKRVYDHCHRK